MLDKIHISKMVCVMQMLNKHLDTIQTYIEYKKYIKCVTDRVNKNDQQTEVKDCTKTSTYLHIPKYFRNKFIELVSFH